MFVVPISDHVMVRLGGDSFMCKYLNKRIFLKGMTCDLKCNLHTKVKRSIKLDVPTKP